MKPTSAIIVFASCIKLNISAIKKPLKAIVQTTKFSRSAEEYILRSQTPTDRSGSEETQNSTKQRSRGFESSANIANGDDEAFIWRQ